MSNLILQKINYLQTQKNNKSNLGNLNNNNKFWNITYEQGLFLSNLVQINNPSRILEIGTSNGFSTLFLAKSLNPSSIIDTVEVDSLRFEIAKRNFESCNLKNINQYLGKAQDIILKFKGNYYEFVFIDALQAQYLEFLTTIENLNLIDEKTILIFDNVKSHGNMDEFIEYSNKNYHIEHINLGGGMLFLTKTIL